MITNKNFNRQEGHKRNEKKIHQSKENGEIACNINGVVKVSLTEKLTLEKDSKEIRCERRAESGRQREQAEGTASTKAQEDRQYPPCSQRREESA